MENKTRIVCAAVRMEDGEIVLGVRHFSPDMRQILRRLYGTGYGGKVKEQGFVDTLGRFLTREEALVCAREFGQLRKDVPVHNELLFSENLY